jgi:ribosome-binding protein aMBF1 (putative translation factor)
MAKRLCVYHSQHKRWQMTSTSDCGRGEHQDWAPRVIDRRGRRTAESKEEWARRREQETGVKVTAIAAKPFAVTSGGRESVPLDPRKVETAEVVTLPKVSLKLSQALQQARVNKGLTQRALAVMVNEKPSVIASYETGTAVPVPALLTKLKRALGMHP